jgi:hypothetical protein
VAAIPVTNIQLYLSIGLPILVNAAFFGLLMAYINARFEKQDERFAGVNQRFDDMRQLWISQLRRVEDVLDARLKHIEEERR